MEPVSITDGSLLLRPPRSSDVPAVFAACQDPEIARWTTVPVPYALADAHRWVEVEVPLGWSGSTAPVWHVTDPADPSTVLASIGLHHLDLEHGDGEVGYWTVPAARGRGITTAAVRLVCRWAFDELGLHRVDWAAAVGNRASRRVAEKAGFAVEGTTRQRLVTHGRREDAWYGGLLPRDLPPPERPVTWFATPTTSVGTTQTQQAPAAWTAPEGVEITAGALHLRPFRPTDVDAIEPLITEPQIAQWSPFRRTGTARDDAIRYIERAMDPATGTGFAVVDATSGELLGGTALYGLDRDAGLGELGYWTVPAARGQGVAPRAAGATARWAFGALGLDRIELWHAVENTASCRVAEAIGFRHELNARESYRYGDGVRHDEHLHGRLATDRHDAAATDPT